MIYVAYQDILQVRIHENEYRHVLVWVLDHTIRILHIIVAQVEVGLVSASSDCMSCILRGLLPCNLNFKCPWDAIDHEDRPSVPASLKV